MTLPWLIAVRRVPTTSAIASDLAMSGRLEREQRRQRGVLPPWTRSSYRTRRSGWAQRSQTAIPGARGATSALSRAHASGAPRAITTSPRATGPTPRGAGATPNQQQHPRPAAADAERSGAAPQMEAGQPVAAAAPALRDE